MLFHQIQFYPFFRRTIRASSLFIRKKNFIYNFLRYLLSVFKVKFFQLCICFFRALLSKTVVWYSSIAFATLSSTS